MVVAGVIAALISEALEAPDAVNIVVGLVAAPGMAAGHGVKVSRAIRSGPGGHGPRFPR